MRIPEFVRRLISGWVFLLCVCGWNAAADGVDDLVKEAMAKAKVPGLSLAIVDGGKVVRAQGYGFADRERKIPVTTETLFQAASISKVATAMAALKVVEEGKLSLDGAVNAKLRTWKIPDNSFTISNEVTLRELLSHTAGMTIFGFAGYEIGQPLPSLVQILDGVKPPANSSPVRVFLRPGSEWRYSGGGYTVIQQLLMNATGKEFSALMRESILEPMGMSNSTFAQPLPAEWNSRAAHGYSTNGEPIIGGWHIYPQMAAAGLWTTPSDLGKLMASFQQSLAGSNGVPLSPAMAQLMVTPCPQSSTHGVGLFLAGKNAGEQFYHTGRNEGFDSFLLGSVYKKRGVVIMINANDNSKMLATLTGAIVRQYDWSKNN